MTRPDPATFAAQLALAAAVGSLAALVIPAHIAPAPQPILRVMRPIIRVFETPPSTREVQAWPRSTTASTTLRKAHQASGSTPTPTATVTPGRTRGSSRPGLARMGTTATPTLPPEPTFAFPTTSTSSSPPPSLPTTTTESTVPDETVTIPEVLP